MKYFLVSLDPSFHTLEVYAENNKCHKANRLSEWKSVTEANIISIVLFNTTREIHFLLRSIALNCQ